MFFPLQTRMNARTVHVSTQCLVIISLDIIIAYVRPDGTELTVKKVR